MPDFKKLFLFGRRGTSNQANTNQTSVSSIPEYYMYIPHPPIPEWVNFISVLKHDIEAASNIASQPITRKCSDLGASAEDHSDPPPPDCR